MSDIGLFLWKLSNMPAASDLGALLVSYGVRRVAIKVLDGTWRHNVPSQTVDAPLVDYIDTLRDFGIIVEAWGYHYPTQPGPQGDAIEERRAKLGFSTYHIDIEGEWKQQWGMGAAIKTLLDKLHKGSTEYLICSYRYPSLHNLLPWNAAMNHVAIDGASPQVYWIGSHNPAEQLQRSWTEYLQWGKPFIPVGAAFDFDTWSPTLDDIDEFLGWCAVHSITRHYWWSLDWIITHQRFDWLTAITGHDGSTPPPPPVSSEFLVANCSWANVRSEPNSLSDNRVAIVRAGQHVTNLHVQSGNWDKVGMGPIMGWIHGDYTEP